MEIVSRSLRTGGAGGVGGRVRGGTGGGTETRGEDAVGDGMETRGAEPVEGAVEARGDDGAFDTCLTAGGFVAAAWALRGSAFASILFKTAGFFFFVVFCFMVSS